MTTFQIGLFLLIDLKIIFSKKTVYFLEHPPPPKKIKKLKNNNFFFIKKTNNDSRSEKYIQNIRFFFIF